MALRYVLALAAAPLIWDIVPAQAVPAADALAAGDRAYEALDAPAALEHYERAVALDSTSYEALWKASRSAADLEPAARVDRVEQMQLIGKAESYARRAVALRADDADGRFALARALGIAARSVRVRARIRYGNGVREHALECLRYAPNHSGCLHVMGAWNAEVMRLSGVERFIARRFLGGRSFDSASWEEAVRYMEAAVAAAPWRIAHRNELAEIYAEVGRVEDAKREYQAALRLPVADYNDERYKARASSELERISRSTSSPPRAFERRVAAVFDRAAAAA